MQIQMPLLAKCLQYCGGLGPQWTVALLPPFAKQSHLKRLSQLEIAGTQVSDLLPSAAGIEHRCEQSVVTASLWCGPVDRRENRVNLLVFQVINRPRSCALEGNAQNTLRQFEMLRIPRRQIGRAHV